MYRIHSTTDVELLANSESAFPFSDRRRTETMSHTIFKELGKETFASTRLTPRPALSQKPTWLCEIPSALVPIAHIASNYSCLSDSGAHNPRTPCVFGLGIHGALQDLRSAGWGLGDQAPDGLRLREGAVQR